MDEVKRMALFFFVAVFLLVIMLHYFFLIPKVLSARSHEDDLRYQIKKFANRIAVISRLNKEGLEKELDLLNKRLPKKEQIPTILDELEQLGKEVGIEIAFLQEQKLRKPVVMDVKVERGSYKFNYQVLPLTINLTCSYIKLAEFLEALDNWSRGVVVVKGFGIQRDEVVPGRIKVENLMIEIAIIGDGNE